MLNNGNYITIKALYVSCDNIDNDDWTFVVYSTVDLYRKKKRSLAWFEGKYEDMPAKVRNAEIEAFQIDQEREEIYVYTTDY